MLEEKQADGLNLISLYISDLKDYDLLDEKDEIELFMRIKNEKDEQAKHLLILSNLRLVVSEAKKLLGNGMPLIDLISEGNMGLMKAIERFDYKKGHRFSTYAVWWIRQTIKKSIVNVGRDIRIPSYKYEQLSKVNKVIESYQLEIGKTPSANYIADKLKMKESKIVLLQNEFQDIISLNETIGDNICLEDIIGQENDIEEDIIKKDQIERVTKLLSTELSERERVVLELRYGLDKYCEHTLKEIGDILKITRERVRQIEKRAIDKLKLLLEEKKDK